MRRTDPISATSLLSSATGYTEVTVVIKAVSNSLLSLLMVVTLIWGGCISCPKFFMFPGSETKCCEKDGSCKRPAKPVPAKECKKIALEPAGLILHDAEPAVSSSSLVIDIPSAPQPSDSNHLLRVETAVASHSPPDLTLLHSAFLI